MSNKFMSGLNMPAKRRSNKPFPQTPVLTDEEISRALSKQGYTDEVHAELQIIALAQRDLSDRNRDKQWIELLRQNGWIATDCFYISLDLWKEIRGGD